MNPYNLPEGTHVLPLLPNSKEPRGARGHHAAVPLEEYDLSFTPELYNYGISLEGKYCLLDVDDPDVFWKWAKENSYEVPAGVWSQKTRRGFHYLFPHLDGGKNMRLPGADVKVHGYLVGPGSIVEGHQYTFLGGEIATEVPGWLATELLKGTYVLPEYKASADLHGIPSGEHDNFLASYAGWLRHRGLAEEAIRTGVMGAYSLLQDVDPNKPYTEKDAARIAKSVSKYEPGKNDEILEDSVEWGDEYKVVGPPKRWWIYGFVPRGELVMLNGKGSAGKSTFASYIAAQVAIRGGKVLRIGSEEPFHRYLARVYLANANPHLVGNLTDPHRIKLPDGASAIRKLILEHKIDFVYFDSIMDHFSSNDSLNAAERARACLSPLAAVAIDTGATILCTFHENKNGVFMGSTEMENVGRVRLGITRVTSKSVVSVQKTNFKEPTYRMMLTGEMITPSNPDGEVALEEDEEGNMVPDQVFVVDGFAKIGSAELTTNDYQEVTKAAAVARAEKIVSYAAAHPDATQKEIGAALGYSEKTVNRAFKRIE